MGLQCTQGSPHKRSRASMIADVAPCFDRCDDFSSGGQGKHGAWLLRLLQLLLFAYFTLSVGVTRLCDNGEMG